MSSISYSGQQHEIDSLIEEMNYVHEISRRISEKKPLDILLAEIMESCKILLKAEASSLLIYDEKEDCLFFQVVTGEKGEIIKNTGVRLGEGIGGWVAQNREALLIEDCYNDVRFNKEFDKQSDFRTKSMLCVPMIHKEKLIGVLQVINKKDDGIFNDRDLSLFKLLANQCAISIENARLIEVQVMQEAFNRELKTAREIQQNLLPKEIPTFNDLDIAMTIIPAKQVGGDYYNIYNVSKDQTLFFVSDVSGKSISAALIVSTICSAIKTYFRLNIKFNLMEFVKCLNGVLIESTTEEKFATCWFGLYNHPEKKLTSINAGHNTIFVSTNNGNIIELCKGGIMLGFSDLDFEHEDIMLNKDDVILLYTDGVPEAMDAKGGFYGDDRLVNLLKENSSNSSREILDNLLKEVSDFVNGAEQSDDITCGAIKVL
ncbi:MAG: GAF domain-containing SpoIIE family protein phosphatase [Ignavibacteria bacterium]